MSLRIAHLLLLLALLLPAAPQVHADPTGIDMVELRVEPDATVLYCHLALAGDRQRLEGLLDDGMELTFRWDIAIEGHRRYWLNKSIGNVTIERRVVPDLVSRSFLLIDATNGINRRVAARDEAIEFLLHLRHFPLLDRALLQSGGRYRLTAELSMQAGNEESGWFARWWGSDERSGSVDFSLP